MAAFDNDLELRIAQSQLLQQLLTRVGFAIWQAAECEDTLAHYIVVRLRSARGVGETAGLKLLEKAQSRTFGHLLRELRDAELLTGELDEQLGRLVGERNWLVHRAKRESRGVLNDISKFDTLIARINRIASDATALNTTLALELEEFVVQSGVSRSQIDSEAERLAESWGY